jgi:hypothetical protein
MGNEGLQVRMHELVNAGFAGLYVQSHEPDNAVLEIHTLAHRNEWSLLVWDVDAGLSVNGGPPQSIDPFGAIKSLARYKPADPSGATLLVLHGFHRFLGDPAMIAAVQRMVTAGKAERTYVVIVAPVVALPVDLEKQFVVVEHALPDREQIREIMVNVANGDGEIPDDQAELNRLLDSAVGLTRYEAEGAFALSLARHGKLVPSVLWEIKAGMLKKSGTLELYRGTERFADLGGLEGVKDFCVRALQSTSTKARPRGVMLVGVPGAGKSALAKALGNETGRPTISFDLTRLKGGIVGETESRTRAALSVIDAMSPCIAFVDEIEKGLAGTTGTTTDGGASMAMLGTLLTWLNDHTSDVFFIGTANDLAALSKVSSGAFTRSERFDAVFFIDVPSRSQREAIWEMYERQYDLTVDASKGWEHIDHDEWTGAEIKSCCRLAALLDIPLVEAAKKVVPVTRSAADSIKQLREISESSGYLDANTGEAYRRAAAPAGRSVRGRSVVRAGNSEPL